MGEKMTLLPCPFCGMAPEIVTRPVSYGREFWYVYHPEHPRGECILSDEKFSSESGWNTRHLATPAQTVDVEAVKTLLELVEGEHGGDHTEADCRHCVAFNKLSQAIGDKA